MRHRIRDEIVGVLVFVAVLWVVFGLDAILPGEFNSWGIRPRTAVGLSGIPLAPFLHGDLWHLLNNSVPLLILLMLLAGSRANSIAVVAALVLLAGALLWLVGRDAVHIGASALVFALITFLVVAGFLEKRPKALLVSIVVAFLYGSTLLWGVLPTLRGGVSWEGHLCGAIAGVGLAFVMTRSGSAAAVATDGYVERRPRRERWPRG